MYSKNIFSSITLFCLILLMGCKEKTKTVPPEVISVCESISKNIPQIIKFQFDGVSRVDLMNALVSGDNITAPVLLTPIINDIYSLPKPKDEAEVAARVRVIERRYMPKCIIDTMNGMKKN